MAIRFVKNFQAYLRQLIDKDVLIVADAGVPVDGASGTGAGHVGKGSLYIDTTNGKIYINSGAGTKLVPVWKIVTSA